VQPSVRRSPAGQKAEVEVREAAKGKKRKKAKKVKKKMRIETQREKQRQKERRIEKICLRVGRTAASDVAFLASVRRGSCAAPTSRRSPGGLPTRRSALTTWGCYSRYLVKMVHNAIEHSDMELIAKRCNIVSNALCLASVDLFGASAFNKIHGFEWRL
jgi:hypothetical protein